MAATISISAANMPISLFPLEHYDQNVDTWLPPGSPDYHKAIISTKFQKKRMEELYRHTFSTGSNSASPWAKNFINAIVKQQPGLAEFQSSVLEEFNNKGKDAAHISYGENYRPYPSTWIENIAENISLDELKKVQSFSEQHRAIMTQNSSVRALPTHDVNFFSYQIAGQGYPFDNLQVSKLWVGTPIYVFGYTKDRRWALITSPAEAGWVPANTFGQVNNRFITRWQKAAKKSLLAITRTQTPVLSKKSQVYQFTTYIGAIFPLKKTEASHYRVWIPVRNFDGQADIQEALVAQTNAKPMPLAATPANFAQLLKSLQNRPYGWGNLYSYNDCSAEMKSLFLPFGIWLPRNSSQQVFMGRTYDKTSRSPAERIEDLVHIGHPLMTIVYIGGHIFLYVGNYPEQNKNLATATIANVITYQNVWGMSPADNSRRAIIGQSLFMPLRLSYPEDPNLRSQAAAKHYFVIGNLDETPSITLDMAAQFFGDLKTKLAEKERPPIPEPVVAQGVNLKRQ